MVAREHGAHNTKIMWVLTTSLFVCVNLYVCPALQTMTITTQATPNLTVDSHGPERALPGIALSTRVAKSGEVQHSML